MRALLVMLALVAASPTSAQELHPFKAGSLQQIIKEHDRLPFVLVFWSVDCAHCQTELDMLGELLREEPRLPLVLVSTDGVELNEAIHAVLGRHELHRAQAWVFADTYVERLRFEVDPRWYGELPRTYFYRNGRITQAVSGPVREQTLRDWLQAGKKS